MGSLTSGGTESILVAMAAYRQRARARKPWIRRPEVVAARTVHPAFDKAAHWFGIRLRKVDVDDDQRLDVAARERAVGVNTIAIVAAALSGLAQTGAFDAAEAAAAIRDLGLDPDSDDPLIA